MRIILSRKGFDSAAGGCPSPIFPDGRLFSLPIPDKTSPIAYGDIQFDGMEIGELVAQLTRDPKRKRHFAHLDPDLRPDALRRLPGWRPLLGQTGSAQGHLRNEQVQPGDIFIFFGSFRPVEQTDSGWCFKRNEVARHVIWGWLQIGEVLKVDDLPKDAIPWAHYHPHFAYGADKSNTLYLASDQLSLKGQVLGVPGAGTFPCIDDQLVLTVPDSKKQTRWRLPAWAFPSKGRPRLSFHPDVNGWILDGDFCFFDSAPRGQEFVFDTNGEQAPMEWIRKLLVRRYGTMANSIA